MQKEKKSSKNHIPIHLSANKKTSFSSYERPHEALFAPCRIQWKSSCKQNQHSRTVADQKLKEPFKVLENSGIRGQSSQNKFFYESMKNQLTTIKQDVEKMLLKEKKEKIQSNPLNGCIKSISIKNKCQKKTQKPEKKYQSVEENRRQKIFLHSSQKTNLSNLIQVEMKKMGMQEYNSEKMGYPRTRSKSIIEMSRNKPSSEQNHEDLKQPKKIAIDVRLNSGIKRQNSRQSVQENQENLQQVSPSKERKQKLIEELQNQLKSLGQLVEQNKAKYERSQRQNQSLKEQIEKIRNDFGKITEKHEKETDWERKMDNLTLLLEERNRQILKLQENNTELRGQKEEYISKLLNLETQCQAYLQKNKQLTDQRHTQLRGAKQLQAQLSTLEQKLRMKQNQLQIYQDQLAQARQKLQQSKRHQQESSQGPATNQTLSKLQQELVAIQCQKNKLIQLNDQYYGQISQLRSENSRLSQQNNAKAVELIQLRTKLEQKQLETSKEAQKVLTQSSFKELGEQFSHKMSTIIDQNYSLKNKISHLEARLEQLQLHNISLREEVRLYEGKVKNNTNENHRLKIEDWDNLNAQLQEALKQKEEVVNRLREMEEYYSLDVMKKQNKISQLTQTTQELLEQLSCQGISSQQIFVAKLKNFSKIKGINQLFAQFKLLIDQNVQLRNKISVSSVEMELFQ